jgi:hypothetical protein
MATQRSQFGLANIAGYTDIPASAIVSGNSAFALLLMAIQANADFGVCSPELFYDELMDGDTVPLHQSSRDGYNFRQSDMIYFPEFRATFGLEGIPAAAGGLQQIQNYVNQQTGEVSVLQTYYVQGGAYSNEHDGILSVWSFGQRGRGALSVSGSPAFSPVANSSLVQDQPLGQSLWRKLHNNARAPKCEAFVLNGSGAAFWQASQTLSSGALIQPNYGHEDGCWYEAVEVYGATGTVEPKWPGYVGGIVVDGGIVWIGVGFGFQNGQSVPYPTSFYDQHVYSSSSGDTIFYLPYFRYTGAVQSGTQVSLGPSASNGATRIQRLQKSVSSGVVNSTVTYWNGGGTPISTHDGLLGVIAVCFRPTATISPTASDFIEFTGSEFAPGCAPSDTNLQNLNGNINFARLTPEGFYNSGLTNTGSVPTPSSPVDSPAYAYQRQELLYPWVLKDTGAMSGDYALRAIQLSVDPITGEVHTRIDYNKGGNQQTTGNGTIDVLCAAFRKAETLLSGVNVIPTVGTSTPAGPGTGNLVPNGDFNLWSGISQQNQQLVGLPDLWNYTQTSADGYCTQQPGLPGGSQYAVGCAVGNHSAPADTQWDAIGSAYIPIQPGGTYEFKIIADANPSLSQGMYVRLHFRDANFENDTIVTFYAGGAGTPLGALGTSPTTFDGHIIMPNEGDSYLQTTAWGALEIAGGPLSYVPAYCWVEIGNMEPNQSSTVIYGLVSLVCLSLDAISPVNASGSFTVSAILTQSGTSTTIEVAASTLQLAGRQIQYSAGSVSPASYGQWWIYADDPSLAGGAVTYQATANYSDVFAAAGRVCFGSITTSSGGGGTGGSGGTGGGGHGSPPAGSLAAVTVANGGSNYTVNQQLTVNQSGGNAGILTITGVSGTAVSAVSIAQGGSGYSVANGVSTTAVSGPGTGCTVNITAV